jgi:hypothetical protein
MARWNKPTKEETTELRRNLFTKAARWRGPISRGRGGNRACARNDPRPVRTGDRVTSAVRRI